MNFRFYDNGTYKENLNKKDASFYLIDISTDRKGSIYTITDTLKTNIDREDICITLDISYSDYDSPCDACQMIRNRINIDSIEKFYSIYPLIKQIFEFNVFCERWSISVNNIISISTIDIRYNNQHLILNDYESEKTIRKAFSHLDMVTHVSDILSENEVIIMKNGIWEKKLIEDMGKGAYPIFDKFDYIVIPLPRTESVYVLTYKEYKLFRHVIRVNVKLLYHVDDDSCIESDPDEMNWVEMSSLMDILYGCLFMPQLILMEQVLYELPINLEITISTRYRDIKLKIDEKEILVPRNTCMIFIIKRLLEMEP